MLLGHLLGDYLFQNEWMALTKSKNTIEGWYAAFIHCLIYTLSVGLFMQNFDWYWLTAVFLTHFPIDKFSLGEKYMKYVKGGGLRNYIDTVNWTNPNHPPDDFTRGHQMLTGGFKAVVYAVTDNAMHLILMFIAYQLIY